MKVRSPESEVRSAKSLQLLIWFFVCGVFAVALLLYFFGPLDPACQALIARSGDVPILLPAGCRLTTTITNDNIVGYFEKERRWRGLDFKAWIVCEPLSPMAPRDFAFEHDHHWLPSYVPLTFQYRRTVIILPYGTRIPKVSPVAGEVCVMPWRKYISRVSGQCGEKFSVWK